MLKVQNKLAVPAIFTLCIYAAMFVGSLFLLRSIHPASLPKQVLSRVFVILFFFYLNLVYIWGFRIVSKNEVTLKQIIIPSVAFAVLAFLTLPLVSDDLYTYFYRSRIFVNYKANPYFDVYNKYFFDQYFFVLKNDWAGVTAVYGPFFWMLTSAICFLTLSKLLVTVYAIKLFFLACFFTSVYLVYHITRSKKTLFLFSWSPVIILFGLLDAHNDILMLFLILLSFYLSFEKSAKKFSYKLLSWLAFLLAILVKIYYLPLGLIVFYTILKDTKSLGKKSFIGLSLFIESVLVCVFVYMPFWRGFGTVGRLFEIHNFYDENNFSFGAIPFIKEPIFSVALRYFLAAALLLFTLFLVLKVTNAVLFNTQIENLYLHTTLLYTLFLLNFIRVWNSWYWIFPIGFLAVSNHFDKSKFSYGLLVFLTYFSMFYAIF